MQYSVTMIAKYEVYSKLLLKLLSKGYKLVPCPFNLSEAIDKEGRIYEETDVKKIKLDTLSQTISYNGETYKYAFVAVSHVVKDEKHRACISLQFMPDYGSNYKTIEVAIVDPDLKHIHNVRKCREINEMIELFTLSKTKKKASEE